MPVRSNAAQEEVDPTVGLDSSLVGHALGFQVWGVAIEDVDVLRVDVDVREEVLVHERMIGLWVFAGNTNVLILSIVC